MNYLLHNMLLKQLLLKIKLLLLVISGAMVICSCATSKLGKSGQRKIAGKTYVILGASSGLGRGVAEELGKYKQMLYSHQEGPICWKKLLQE